ncbi:helix-turn-helix domain-containing protein [Mesorhizobium sp. AaZ16]|uniref:helix-turn-helix domain-containing protein n=1 Tax=Mesorhizobium sp. AaZ16 TaxID=3402289 RepID=UPI00374F5D29
MTSSEFRAIRKRLGLTQAQLASLLGYTSAMTISAFERPTNPRVIPAQLGWLMEALDSGFWPSEWPPKKPKVAPPNCR